MYLGAVSYTRLVLICSICGKENPRGARFCNECGGPLASLPSRATRKTVTVFFADVTGSTALGERLDPESLRHVMARYFEIATACVERHGGTVEKFIGDAVMAVFGVPSAHEDDALRAVKAAWELRESLWSLNTELERDYGVSLAIRVGLNTGEAVVGTEERLATGDVVNVAARFEQAAQPGEILLGEPTFRLARDAIEVEALHPLLLKGKEDLVPAHRLVSVVEGAPGFERRFDGRLVGRRDELTFLRRALETAISERRCRLVTVLGPPGIGKSRLAREVTANFADDAIVLAGRCLPYGEGITYWPLREIFAAADAEAELESALGADGVEEIFWAVRKAVERRARERPLVLVVEDIHWAEPTLLDLLEHLVDWSRDAPLLLLCLARPELRDERPGWGGELVTLEPLSEAHSDELIEELVGESSLDVDARTRIRTVAEGNPLFVEQLLATVAAGGKLENVPPTIQALLAARLDALPSEERDLLERASVVGLEFEWEALAALAHDGRRPAGAQLAGLVRKELIRPHDGIEDLFEFRHMLIRDAAYDRIAKELRVELHERVAGWLDGRDEEFDEIVAYHLEQAYRCLVELGPPADRARKLAVMAAERLAACGSRANDRGDAQAVAGLLDRASALLPPTDGLRLGLLPTLGRALRGSGQLERADAVLSEAVELGRATGLRGVAADAAVALTDLRFHRAAQTGVGRDDVRRELDAAIPVFEELGDEAALARALCLGGKLRFWRGEAATAIEDFVRAARHAGAAGDRAGEAESLHYALTALDRGPTPADELLARFEEIRLGARSNRRLEVSLLTVRAHREAMRGGSIETARDLISQARALAEEHGLRLALDSEICTSAGAIELLAGTPTAAEGELRRACESLERIGELGYLSSVAPLLADALYLQGRHDEAFQLTERWPAERLTVPEDVDAHVGWRRVRAKVLARRGEFNQAERLAREATTIAAGTDFLPLRAEAAADLAEVLRLAGQTEQTAAALDEAIGLHEMKGNLVAAGRLRALRATPGVEV
jgi:class 3 adenylate cyclase/tetratricopeptide (TPR) repeat protein